MSFLRKWHKFITHPQAFFRDSKLNALWVRHTLPQNSHFHFTHTFTKLDWDCLLNILDENDVCAVYILPVSGSLKPTLTILPSEKARFLDCLWQWKTQVNLDLQYQSGKHMVRPHSWSAIWRDCANASQLDFVLSHHISKSKLHFTLAMTHEYEAHFLLPHNHLARKLDKNTAQQYGLFQAGVRDLALILDDTPHENDITFDVDLVFTWVNAADVHWQTLYQQHKPSTHADGNSLSRFHNRDELKYALRSWAKYGDFVRKIFIVSNCSPPDWLNLSHPKLEWVPHERIMPLDALPTFNSHAIEVCLHHIPNLSPYWIYANDDVFLTKKVDKHTFFHHNGIAKLRLENHGNVYGSPNDHAPDHINAARNSNILLKKTFGKIPTALHTHSPQSMRTDILAEMNRLFAAEFQQTAHHQFRNKHDISVTSYFYQHYALLSGRALASDEYTETIIARQHFVKKFHDILQAQRQQAWDTLPLSVCINDGADSHLNEQWNTAIHNFLAQMFPERSVFEHD